jgi:hypothetical protein
MQLETVPLECGWQGGRYPAVPEFRYAEIDAGIFGTRSSQWSFAASVCLQCLFLLLPVLDILLVPIPVIQVVHPKAPPLMVPFPRIIRLVGVEPEPAKPVPAARKAPLPVILPQEMKPPGGRTKSKAKAGISFVQDRGKHMLEVLQRRHGFLGFGDTEFVRKMFQPPHWSLEPLPREGVLLREFYYLRIDETTGSYEFLDQVRRTDPALLTMIPYALFGYDFQAEIEGLILEVARCTEGDRVVGLIRLDPVRDVAIENIQCSKP